MKKTSSSSKSPINLLYILPKVFLIISVLLLMWIVILISGVSYLEFDPDWAGISISNWLILVSVLFGAFIIIDIVMYVSPSLFVKGEIQEFVSSESQAEFLDGMKVYEYTFPKDNHGGVYSKTYVKIDDSFLLRVRNQMIPAEILWPDKKKKNEQES